MTSARGARSGEEIQSALRQFVQRWTDYSGTERSEAQTFLNELFECYGTNRLDVGAQFEDFHTSATGSGFMDLHWPEVVIIEMKRPSRGQASRAQYVQAARDQLMSYWRESAQESIDRPAARYVVLCSFQRFEIWEPGRYPKNPRISFPIEELPDRYESLLFLAAPSLSATFTDHYKELTKEAAGEIARLYQSLADRSAAPIDEIQRFAMQCVWTLFAEDLGMLEGYPLQVIVDELLKGLRRNSAAEIGYLFRVLNQKGNHNRIEHLAGTRYVNGELFAQPAEVGLDKEELEMLSRAAQYDWRKVDPTIFGSLMEGVLGRERRWELGAHYTHEADIMKIVEPTIVRPWLARIEACASPGRARDLLDELCAFRVLDPACGCGNFLYIAYRELRELEHHLKERITELAHEQGVPVPSGPWPFYPLANLQGIDIERIAVLIARVTLWMGHRQMIDRFGEAEPVLPLVALPGIQRADALRVPWPETDAIVGNPPFLGAKHIRPQFGDAYAEGLTKEFGVGVKDFCVYWFRRAHQQLRVGQRAGLVGTNSVSQTSGRTASLDYIVDNGGVITDAVSTQKWPGEAKVHVSIVNWVKGSPPPGPCVLDGVEVEAISSQLRSTEDSSNDALPLASNRHHAFAGVVPQAKGFVLTEAQAAELLAAGAHFDDVVVRFLNGDDIANNVNSAPSRYVIDFRSWPLERAMKYPVALDVARRLVKPERQASLNRAVEERWWLFGRRVEGMRSSTAVLGRFAAAASTGKRLVLSWQGSEVVANNAVCVFAFEDDFSMGVLLSRTHGAWAWAQASTLKGDLRYTPTSVFMTFPWAGAFATAGQRERVAEASRRLLNRRSEICGTEQIGLTTLYNAADEGAWTDLKALHQELDQAVAACYGWPAAVAQDEVEIVRRLTELNRRIVEDALPYAPFAYLEASSRAPHRASDC